MVEIAVTVVVLLLSVYAITDLVSRVAFWMLFSKKGQQEYYVLPLKNAERVEYAIRRLGMLRWFFPFKNVLFVVLDGGLSVEGKAIADKVCRELRLTFLTEKEWANTLQSTANEV